MKYELSDYDLNLLYEAKEHLRNHNRPAALDCIKALTMKFENAPPSQFNRGDVVCLKNGKYAYGKVVCICQPDYLKIQWQDVSAGDSCMRADLFELKK